jgi:hypothetical protein
MLLCSGKLFSAALADWLAVAEQLLSSWRIAIGGATLLQIHNPEHSHESAIRDT